MNKLSDEERALFQIEHWNAQIKAGDKEYQFIKDSIKRRIPKKPKNIRNIAFVGSMNPTFSEGECPSCGEYVDTDDDRYVCGQKGCGQALDWSIL